MSTDIIINENKKKTNIILKFFAAFTYGYGMWYAGTPINYVRNTIIVVSQELQNIFLLKFLDFL
jgi:hypothetical protein